MDELAAAQLKNDAALSDTVNAAIERTQQSLSEQNRNAPSAPNTLLTKRITPFFDIIIHNFSDLVCKNSIN